MSEAAMSEEAMSEAASLNELFAILLARDLRPEDQSIQIGANMQVARVAAAMAGLSTHPNARIVIGLGILNLASKLSAPPVRPFLFDPRTPQAEAMMFQAEVFDDMSWPDVFFFSGLQLDRRGNLNLFGIPDGEGGWKLRGPGSVALATMATHCRGYYIVMPRHDPRTFVERVSLVSALGDPVERARLGLPGGGLRLVLSPLGVFALDEDGNLAIQTLHEGVTFDQVQKETGFDLTPSEKLRTTPPPTQAELRLLRERADVHRSLA
jgi:glutaconate CoA-transferase, subunit B